MPAARGGSPPRHALRTHPIGDRLGEVDPADRLRLVEVGERARHPQHAVIGARGKAELLAGVAQQRKPGRVGRGDLLDQRRRTMRVGRRGGASAARTAPAGSARAPRTRAATSALGSDRPGRIRSLAETAGTSIAQVDAVEQRAGDARLVVGLAARAARAAVAGFAGHAAAAGVHRRDELDPRRIGHAVVGPRDHAFAALERLAQRIQRLRREFRKFVEEQHAVVRQRHLARTHAKAAADQRGHRCRMVRRAERPPIRQLAAGKFARHRGDHRDLEQFLRLQRGRMEGSRCASIDLPEPGGPIIRRLCPPAAATSSARSRALLSLDVGEVGQVAGGGMARSPPAAREPAFP